MADTPLPSDDQQDQLRQLQEDNGRSAGAVDGEGSRGRSAAASGDDGAGIVGVGVGVVIVVAGRVHGERVE